MLIHLINVTLTDHQKRRVKMIRDRFNIADVARIHGLDILRETGGETQCVCPFCGDKRGKFSYILNKGGKENMYHCFKCGASGTAVDLHIELSDRNFDMEDDRYKAAIKDIFEAINGDTALMSYHSRTKELIASAPLETQRASDRVISETYYALLRLCKLNPEHKKDLIRRGLDEVSIKRFRFKSTPKDPKEVCRILIARGYTLEGVPGFYLDDENHWTFSIAGGGYFCPSFDAETNYITGFQIRVDNPKRDAKYLWFSSAGKNKGVTSGSRATYLIGREDKCVLVTEGILKATVIYTLLNGSITVIGVPGISNLKCLDPYLSKYSSACIVEAFDMDKMITEDMKDLLEKTLSHARKKGIAPENVQEEECKSVVKTLRIENSSKKLCEKVSQLGFSVHRLTWDTDSSRKFWNGKYKGLDDFLCEYDKPEVFTAYVVKKARNLLALRQKIAALIPNKQNIV